MEYSPKKIGVIISVDGNVSQVGLYNTTNDADVFWYGDILSGAKVGAFVTIHQNMVKIIATVVSESIIDQQNISSLDIYDNRYKKNSMKRSISLKVKGVIENQRFNITSRFVPMIGNEVCLTTQAELDLIYGVVQSEPTIRIGKSLLEGKDINIPIDKIFASHIGIFGNTGSGKSNTLHKMYYELFQSPLKTYINQKSQFFVIDFNGEYVGKSMFGLTDDDKEIFNISTRTDESDKIIITKKYLLDPDLLSILFDAKPGTQVPFLRDALRKYKSIKTEKDFADLEVGLLITILQNQKNIDRVTLEKWIKIGELLGLNDSLLKPLKKCSKEFSYGNTKIANENNELLLKNDKITDAGNHYFKFDDVKEELANTFKSVSEIKKLYFFIEFQRVYVAVYDSKASEFISPMIKRIENSLDALDRVVEIKDNISASYKMLNIFSLVNANQEVTRLIPMLISKMFYDIHKNEVSGSGIVNKTMHLIIDEAHNILNDINKNNRDDWKDYRLSVFEEIIKEGRKFGFYLTLASQRPSDISMTIVSQLHNFFVHRIVNDKDLQLLENTMPTLDYSSYKRIPLLGQGEVVITGKAFNMPFFVVVNRLESVRPNSDDISLVRLWDPNPNSDG
ncbi:ATP-binding protein [Veillonella sp. ACP1]|uniref:ATP-binding protein n=1 Tax=Veillonella sp. ACP1 TaxID=936588 RepID=UPI0002780632|nr:ATP-binding protein [Veillonella sp. ACP1]EJO50613.1 PF01935 domain protein [Veillonella sp. ACP1]